MTEGVVVLDSPAPSKGSWSREAAVAAVLFGLALVAYFTANAHGARLARPLPLALFALLAGGYIALGVPDVARRLSDAFPRASVRIVAGPLVLWTACVLYAAAAGLSVGDRALAFAVYLAIPSLIFATGQAKPGQLPWRELAAAASLGLGRQISFASDAAGARAKWLRRVASRRARRRPVLLSRRPPARGRRLSVVAHAARCDDGGARVPGLCRDRAADRVHDALHHDGIRALPRRGCCFSPSSSISSRPCPKSFSSAA